ncbi:hypothetical protein DXG01_007126 [Tephrocybe rancida]|nr:hypothetical protein DXG01_007126 [Tephrocybe rancida]
MSDAITKVAEAILKMLNMASFMAFSVIFTSPSSANCVANDCTNENKAPTDANGNNISSKATKSSVTTKLKLEAVTPCTIAYAAIMLHFSLTDAPFWKVTYNNFNYEHFYNFIVDFFEDVDGVEAQKRVKSLLKWWNK